MKKNLVLLAATLMCLTGLTACKSDEPASTPTEATTTAAPETTTAAESQTAATTEAETEPEYYSQDVYITNSTGVAIMELYISDANSKNWGEDLLSEDIFDADETLLFTPDVVGTADARWDIMAVDEDGDEITFTDVDLSSVTGLILHWGDDGKTPTVSFTDDDDLNYYSQDLDITNGTGVAITEMYISPSNDDNWGEDMLGEDIFEADKTMTFTTDLVGTAGDTWDIKIVDEDGDEVTFQAIDFSSSVELILHWGDDGRTPTVTMN